MNLWERNPIPVRCLIDANIGKHVKYDVCLSVDDNIFGWFRRNIVGIIGEPIDEKMAKRLAEEFNR